jgi:menaquinone-dependent protoporphyrinogen oxidase
MRRKLFVITGCIVCMMLLCLPGLSHAKRGLPDSVVEKSYGDNNTGARVLVAFATNYGSTYRISDLIAAVLSAEGFKVDLKFVDNDTIDLSKYDAVILGSNIYIEKWNTKATAFLDKYKTELATKKVAYYCVCMILGMDLGGKEKQYAANYLKLISDGYPEIVPKASTAFAGAVDYRILKPKDWLLLHSMFAQPGNWTDYGEVVLWAYELSDKLK